MRVKTVHCHTHQLLFSNLIFKLKSNSNSNQELNFAGYTKLECSWRHAIDWQFYWNNLYSILDLIGIVRESLYRARDAHQIIYFNDSTGFIDTPNYTSPLCNHRPIILLLTHTRSVLYGMTTAKNLLLILQDRTILFLWQTCCYSWWPVLHPVSCTATWFAGSTWRPGWPAGSWWWPHGRRPPLCADTSGPRTSSESAGPGCSPNKALSVIKDIPTSLTCL